MPQLTSLLRGLGAAGAAANARAELDRAYTERTRAEVAVRRVNRSTRPDRTAAERTWREAPARVA